MITLIAIVLITLSLLFRRSKTVTVLFFLFMWTLWGWNEWNGDYEAYESMYYEASYLEGDMEVAYMYITYLFNALHVSFKGYMVMVSFFVLVPFLYYALKFSRYPALFAVFYFFIFIMEFVFTRNYIVHGLLLMALMGLMLEVRHYKIIAIALLLLSSLIHYSSLVFFVFLFAFYTGKPLSLKIILSAVLVMVFVSVVFYSEILSYFGAGYIEKLNYYKDEESRFTTVALAHLIIVLLMFYIYRISQRTTTLREQQKRIFTIMYNVNVLSLVYLVFYYHVPYFGRFIRFLFAFDIGFVLSAFYFATTLNRKIKIGIVFAALIAALFILFSTTTFHYTMEPMFRYNSIWTKETHNYHFIE